MARTMTIMTIQGMMTEREQRIIEETMLALAERFDVGFGVYAEEDE